VRDDRGMSRRERLAKLELEMTAAETALEGDSIEALERASSALLHTIDWDWLISEQPQFVEEAVSRARDLRQRVIARIAALQVAELEHTLTPCPSCHGVKLLVARNCTLSGVLADEKPLNYSLVVCKECGDMRMRCDEIDKLDGRSVAITLPAAPSHPFR
jgi:hypothetical protein